MDKYVLELHWLNVRYGKNEKGVIIYLDGAYFSGPALKIASKIIDNDAIRLDFTEQYVILLNSYHIATLKWGEVIYASNIVYLKDALLCVSNLCKVPEFLCDDYLVIDTSLHEEKTHEMYLNYKTKTFSSFRVDYAY
jgi:hypothetical protein